MSEIKKEDYFEPRCPLCNPQKVQHIPVQRILEKFDGYLYKKDYTSAINVLDYWIKEAEENKDVSGALSLYNEKIGYYRKRQIKEETYYNINKCLELVSLCEIKGTVLSGTTYLNIATGFRAFGENEKAVIFYDKAEKIYLEKLNKDDYRLCGLYNNKATALYELNKYDDAEKLYNKALSVLEKLDGTETEIAITYCNLADLEEKKSGDKDSSVIKSYLEKVKENLDSNFAIKDGNYAYVCEKCAPAFSYYGDESYAKILEKRASDIYERH